MLRYLTLLVLSTIVACGGLRTYKYPSPVSTKTQDVRVLDDEVFRTASGVTAAADFPGARLASFSESGIDSASGLPLYLAEIPAENEPINPSPWYSFALTATPRREVLIRLVYPEAARHRYQPKTATSASGPWTYVPQDQVDTSSHIAEVRLQLGPEPLLLSAQEIVATDSISRWINALQETGAPFDYETIGISKLRRPVWKLESTTGPNDKRPTVVFLSRQHPPEVTGFTAFQAFFERLMEDSEEMRSFRENYRIIAFPVMNPDGVDEGHWRHNAGGIDLNRDWAKYRQPETRTVVTWLQEHTTRDQVVWGMDFHSTQYDVLYTHDPDQVEYSGNEQLTAWTNGLAEWARETYPGASALPDTTADGRIATIGQDTLRVEPDGIGKPTSASWFAKHYKCIGVTYEVGDEQDRDFIKAKARRAAELFAEVLDGRL